MSWQDRIEINPRILAGKPIIKGSRLSVEFIIDLFGNGWSEQQIVNNYPGITAGDLHACLQYAADALKAERVYMLP